MKNKLFLFSFLFLMHGSSLFAQNTDNDSIIGAYYDLDDVVVVADKPLVQSDGTKLSYNMEEDPSARGNTLLDALRKVPMVSIDGEDKIRINGQSNFKIYVNGKEDPSLSANYDKIFKAMPADAVVKVEVITEPGAKYDAEGTAGILNLITVSKNTTDGYSGSLSASMSKSASGGSFYGRMKKGKLAMSANIDYSNGRLFPQKNHYKDETENLNSDDMRYQTTVNKQNVRFDYIGGGINLSYDLSGLDLITANFNAMRIGGDVMDSHTETSVFDVGHNLVSNSRRGLYGVLKNSSINAGASWQHQFDEYGQKTVVSYLYNYGYNSLESEFTPESSQGLGIGSEFQSTSNKGYNHENTIQLDYVNPFKGEIHTLEAGVKAIWRRNDAKASLFKGPDKTNAIESFDDRSDLLQIQDIYAVYSSYKGKFGNFSATAGIRYEHTRMGIDFRYGNYDNFMSRLNDVVPNAALAYNFSTASNIRIAYQMRISRPTLSQVNPYRWSFVPLNVEMGNPDLSSEKANKISMVYSNFGRTFGGNIGVEYSAIDNAIASYYFTEDGINYRTYANIGHNRRLSFHGFLTWSIIPRMQININARAANESFSSRNPDLRNSGWSFNYGADWNYSLASGFRFNIYGGQTTRNYNLQGYDCGWYYYGVGISKKFLKNDALTISANASSFLQSERDYRQFTYTENFISKIVFSNECWNVGISVSWNFGNLKSDVKKTSASINNDDKSSVSNKTGGGL